MQRLVYKKMKKKKQNIKNSEVLNFMNMRIWTKKIKKKSEICVNMIEWIQVRRKFKKKKEIKFKNERIG